MILSVCSVVGKTTPNFHEDHTKYSCKNKEKIATKSLTNDVKINTR